VPDDGEGAAEALGAQRLRRVEPGEGGPDDHDVTVGLEVGHEIVSKHLVLPRSDGSSRETTRWRWLERGTRTPRPAPDRAAQAPGRGRTRALPVRAARRPQGRGNNTGRTPGSD